MSRIFYSGLLAVMTVVGFGMTEGPEQIITPSLSRHAEADSLQVAKYYGWCRRCGRWGHSWCPAGPNCGVRG